MSGMQQAICHGRATLKALSAPLDAGKKRALRATAGKAFSFLGIARPALPLPQRGLGTPAEWILGMREVQIRAHRADGAGHVAGSLERLGESEVRVRLRRPQVRGRFEKPLRRG